jgi:hypothetical protein
VHKLAICAIVKNEHDYLLEWIAYHRVVGVDRFLIYNNCDESDDGTTNLLNKLHAIGAVEAIPWPNLPEWRLPQEVFTRPQVPAYYDGLARCLGRAEWVAFVDADEFIVPMQDEDLPSTLKAYKQYGAVGVNWRMFGSSGEVQKRPVPVCKRFIMASKEQNSVNCHVKCIAVPELVQSLNTHRPFLETGTLVDEHGREIADPRGLHNSISYDILRINHYYTKSREEWTAKVARGKADHPRKRSEESFRNSDFNDERDTFILKFYDATVREMRRLARAAKIDQYPQEETAGSKRTSAAARREYSRTEPAMTRENGSAARNRQSSEPRLPTTPSTIDIRPRGNMGGKMIQLMVAERLRSLVPHCVISNMELPEWGIVHDRVPGTPGEPLENLRAGHRVDIARAASLLSRGPASRLTLVTGGQWLTNFPDLESCRKLFPADEQEFPGYDADRLVCHVEFPEALDWHGVLLPAGFYADVAESMGLGLTFLGQREDNGYWQSLRQRFPNAEFLPSRGSKADFQIFRNSRFLVPGVGASSWLAAWLSRAERIVFPVSGLYHPIQEPNVNLLPLDDPRYSFYLFPINFSVFGDEFETYHSALAGSWRPVEREALAALRVPQRERRIESYLNFFDEEFYLRSYPDVANAVHSGALERGRVHFQGSGFHEGRNAFPFDIRWYSVAYPDAAREVGDGEYVNLLHHYVETGAARGYKPVPS